MTGGGSHVLTCSHCGASVEPALPRCGACGSDVEVGRLSGFLGQVCRACDGYNDAGRETCTACGAPLPATHHLRPGAGPARFPFEAPDQEPAAAPAGAPLAGETMPLLLADLESPGDASAPRNPISAHLGEDGAEPEPPTTPATLVLERGDGTEGTRFPLHLGEHGAGRSRGVLLFPQDPCLDALHATFVVRGDSVLVRDEGSAGGTYLRLRGLTLPIRPGDVFAVGDRLLRYRGPLVPGDAPAGDGTRRLGSPRPGGRAVLVEEQLEGGAGGRVWLRAGPSVTFGRAGCSVDLGGDPYLSQAHAEILVEPDGSARLRDLGSSNGTFVRLPPRAERDLHDGDVVRMGREVLRVVVAHG